MEEDYRCSYKMPEDEDFKTDDIEKSQISELHNTPTLYSNTHTSTTTNSTKKHEHIFTAATRTLEAIFAVLKSKQNIPNPLSQFGAFISCELGQIRDPQLLTNTNFKIYQIITDAQTEQNELDSLNVTKNTT
ncbi:hypothetical protein X975_07470, partial [Stegodyphus mimosarum]